MLHSTLPRRWALVCITLFGFSLPISAADKYGNSLDWVPDDVAFYASSLRWKEQIDIVGNSKAWQKFRAIPSVAMAWQLAEGQLNNQEGPLAMGLQLLQLPENQQLVQMLGDLFSNEVVVYGGPKVADTFELFQAVNSARQLGAIEGAAEGGIEERTQAQAHSALEALKEHLDLLKTPDVVFAFKLTDTAAAKTQLKRLEVLAKMALQQTPLKDRFKREKIGDGEFLTIKLDGSMVPWDQVPFDEAEDEEGEFDDVKKKLQTLTLVVTLGVRNDYLMLSIDDSTASIAKLGAGSTLATVKELAPLAKFRDRKLTSIGYVSKAFASRVQMGQADVDQIVDAVGSGLDAAGLDDDKLKDRLAADIEKLGDDLKKYIPAPGAQAGFSYLTDRGFEGYAYNWTPQLALDGSKPLEIVNHLGGKPVFAIVGRAKYDPESYDLLVKWSKVAYEYVEEFAVPQMEAQQQKQFSEGMEIAKPLLARVDKTTREMLIPALKDGQSALVLDADIASPQWHKEMPKAQVDLPMAELAIVLGVSDAKLFKKAMQEYKAIADEAVVKIRAKNPDAIPADYKVPAPEAETTQGGTVYTYKLPAEAGLDAQIAPSGGIGDHVAVFSTSPKQAGRILAETPLGATGLLAGTQKPCAAALYFDWSALIGAAIPWVDYGIKQANPGGADDIVNQVRSGLEILQCMKTTESVTTIEDGVTVTHGMTTFKDVD